MRAAKKGGWALAESPAGPRFDAVAVGYGMPVAVVTTLPAVIPAGHSVEVIWYVELADPSRELAEPRILDLDTMIEYAAAVHHVSEPPEIGVPTPALPLAVRSGLRRIRTLRGTVRRCIVTQVREYEGEQTRVTLLVEPHSPTTPYR